MLMRFTLVFYMSVPAITITDLTKSFGNTNAIDNLSLQVYPGDVFSFLGSNGSGKTTTFRCLLGIYTPDKGVVHIEGKPFSYAMNTKIGYLPEERGIYTKATIDELFEYFGKLRGIAKSERKKRTTDYLERVDLDRHRTKKIHQLSSGMQQKVQIGITILHRPRLLVLDEPFKGLDPVNRQLFLDIFEEFRSSGSTIIYSTHAVEEVQRLANRLVMIKDGKRLLYGTVDEIRDSFGTNTIKVAFEGRLPVQPSLYSVRTEHNMAELTPADGVATQDILAFLIKQGVVLREFTIDRPSLNDIFIRVAKQE